MRIVAKAPLGQWPISSFQTRKNNSSGILIVLITYFVRTIVQRAQQRACNTRRLNEIRLRLIALLPFASAL